MASLKGHDIKLLVLSNYTLSKKFISALQTGVRAQFVSCGATNGQTTRKHTGIPFTLVAHRGL